MSQKTKIQWCDSTVNFWRGCDKVSAGCVNCYITTTTPFRVSGQKHGDPRVKSAGAVKEALALNRKPWICDECGEAYAPAPDDDNGGAPSVCEKRDDDGIVCGCGQFHRRRIFSLSLGDWLDPEVPIEWLAEMLDTIRQCDQVEWILCTKRPELFAERVYAAMRCNFENFELRAFIGLWLSGEEIPHNITLLTSVENQAMADLRIPQLLRIPAARRGLSMEPLLGPVELYLTKPRGWQGYKLDWLIVGGESGHGARPCNVDWIRDIVRQGQAAGVATFVKQLGAEPRCNRAAMARAEFMAGYTDADPFLKPILRDKKGGDPSEWSPDLRVQEWPRGF